MFSKKLLSAEKYLGAQFFEKKKQTHFYIKPKHKFLVKNKIT